MSIYALLSAFIVSAISLVGIFTLSLKEELLKKHLSFLISLAVGALLGDAFIHLIPESMEAFSNFSFVGILVVAGILIFFILENLLHQHHHYREDAGKCGHIHPFGYTVLFADGIHNLLDGFIIGASYLFSFEVGVATTIAVVLHEIPQEIADFGVLIYAGYSRVQALLFNFLSALLALVGVVIALVVGDMVFEIVKWSIPMIAGGFIYIAASDLIPELNKGKHKLSFLLGQFLFILIGVGILILLLFAESVDFF